MNKYIFDVRWTSGARSVIKIKAESEAEAVDSFRRDYPMVDGKCIGTEEGMQAAFGQRN